MKHKPIELVLKMAEAAWDKNGMPKDKDEDRFKTSFMFGYLQSAYQSAWYDLPNNKKELVAEIEIKNQ